MDPLYLGINRIYSMWALYIQGSIEVTVYGPSNIQGYTEAI